jgi:hypothetical protein
VAVEVDEIRKTDSDGDIWRQFAPVLVFDAGMGESWRERLVVWNDETAARDLSDWLAARLCVGSPHSARTCVD